jgi:CheY-like chemotaxis protein
MTARAGLTMGVVTVADTGTGIAGEDQARVFEEFQQVGGVSARQSGTGLGLALTRSLVQAHGGKIELTSVLGEGAEFTIHLPLAVDDTVPELAPVGLTGPASETGGVLVIEDEPGAARLLRTYLEEAGFSVTVAPTGEAGLELASQFSPDAIVLDVLLPGIDGWEVLRRLKANPACAQIPVIIATVVDEREAAESLGAVDYFVKPIERQQLVRSVTRCAGAPHETPGRSKILVIDDDLSTLRIVDTVLKQQGFHVVTAASGAEGLRIARSQHFDLVICDLLMPDMDGFAVIAALDGDPAGVHVPVVVFTGKDVTEADRKRLGGAILGIVPKGEGGPAALRTWLSWAAEHTSLTSDQPAVVVEPQGASS